MFYDNKVWIGSADGKKVSLSLRMANRHGLITGATGTGKTITLKVLAESFSDAGVPVFISDIKGDLSGMCRPGADSADLQERIRRFGLNECGFTRKAWPTAFWDIYGKNGIPLRTTISEMGPILLSRVLGLNTTQSELMTVIFRIADENQLLLVDTRDLKAMIRYVSDNASAFEKDYGHISAQSMTAILRHVVALEAQGGETYFAEPALDIVDWFTLAPDGRGMMNILDCRELVNNGVLYSAFLLWMLSELYDTLPEIGDPEKPRMVFFFDEAHLLFKGISKALEAKIEQIVRLIRSKGVGVFFISQSPSDIPEEVLGQLGCKIQHALRAYTPKDQKAVKTAAESFRPNPAFDTTEAITSLGTGEALVSVLDEQGIPTMVEKCRILPPQSLMGSISDEDKTAETKKNNLYLKYMTAKDPDSAYEFLERQKSRRYGGSGLNDSLGRETPGDVTGQSGSETLSGRDNLNGGNGMDGGSIPGVTRGTAGTAGMRGTSEANQEAVDRKIAQLEKELAMEREKNSERESKEAEKLLRARQEAEEKERKKKERIIEQSVKSVGSSVGRELGNAIGSSLGGKFGRRIGGNLGSTLGRNLLGTFFSK